MALAPGAVYRSGIPSLILCIEWIARVPTTHPPHRPFLGNQQTPSPISLSRQSRRACVMMRRRRRRSEKSSPIKLIVHIFSLLFLWLLPDKGPPASSPPLAPLPFSSFTQQVTPSSSPLLIHQRPSRPPWPPGRREATLPSTTSTMTTHTSPTPTSDDVSPWPRLTRYLVHHLPPCVYAQPDR